jgi:hypothetical protein
VIHVSHAVLMAIAYGTLALEIGLVVGIIAEAVGEHGARKQAAR